MDESAAERDEVAAAEGLVDAGGRPRRSVALAARAGLGCWTSIRRRMWPSVKRPRTGIHPGTVPLTAFAVGRIRRRVGRAIRQARRSRPRNPATLDGPDRSEPPVDRHRERRLDLVHRVLDLVDPVTRRPGSGSATDWPTAGGAASRRRPPRPGSASTRSGPRLDAFADLVGAGSSSGTTHKPRRLWPFPATQWVEGDAARCPPSPGRSLLRGRSAPGRGAPLSTLRNHIHGRTADRARTAPPARHPSAAAVERDRSAAGGKRRRPGPGRHHPGGGRHAAARRRGPGGGASYAATSRRSTPTARRCSPARAFER